MSHKRQCTAHGGPGALNGSIPDHGWECRPRSVMSSDPATVIRVTTTALRDLVQQQLDLRDQRAAAFARAARMDEALSECKIMMEQAPTSAAGFLRAGAIYAMQGRQLAAIRVYERGLESVPPSRLGFTQLDKEKCSAQAILDEKRIDFVAVLPLDVVHNLVRRFCTGQLPRDRHDCLDVSTTWRERICCCTAFHIECISTDIRPTQEHVDRVFQVAQHAVSLRIWDDSATTYIDRCMKALENGKFSMLQELHIRDCNITRPYALLSALYRVGQSLKELHLLDEKWGRELPLAKVIRFCPALEVLDYQGAYILVEDASAFPTHSKLKQLSLRATEHDIENDTLEIIFKRCPNITSLSLNQCVRHDILDLVRQHRLQMLQHLTINEIGNGESRHHEPLTYSSGITYLQLGSITEFDIGALERCLGQWAGTLESLCLRLGEDIFLRNYMLLTDNTALTKLHTIESYYFDHVGDYIVASIIRSAPNLKSVKFSESGHITFEVFDALHRLRHLESLSLGDCLVDDMDGWLRFLRMHADQGERSTLKVLKIGRNATPQVLEAIANICSLEVFDMTRNVGVTYACLRSMRMMARQFQTFSQLRCIIVREDALVDDHALREISKIPSLKCLELWFMNEITDEGVASLASCTQLERLVVFDCRHVSPVVVRLVKQQLQLPTKGSWD